MPQLQYYPVRETLFSAEAGTRYVSFGLRCCAPEQGVPQLAFIPDVSCDEIFVRGLADRFTRHPLLNPDQPHKTAPKRLYSRSGALFILFVRSVLGPSPAPCSFCRMKPCRH